MFEAVLSFIAIINYDTNDRSRACAARGNKQEET